MSSFHSGDSWAPYPTPMGSDEGFHMTNQQSNYFGVWDFPQSQTAGEGNLPYFPMPVPQTAYPHFITRPAEGVAAVPSTKQCIPRQPSPTYTHASFTSSSNARSPCPETECSQARSPATPRDSQPPPPPMPMCHDNSSYWGIQHTGPPECIKLNDIAPYATTLHAGLESEILDDTCFSSMNSMHPPSLYSVNHVHPEQFSSAGPPTPEEADNKVGDVIQVYEPSSPYPASPLDGQEVRKGHQQPTITASKKNSKAAGATRNSRPNKGANKKRPRSPSSAAPPNKRSKVAEFSCPECSEKSFKDDISLQKHIKSQHTRPFLCMFRFAGCLSTFASKNEWKRHCQSQHLLLFYWLCQEGQCAKVTNTTAGSEKSSACARNRSCASSVEQSGGPALPNGAIFNRKDLYTQHVRRMHVPPAPSSTNTINKKQTKQKKNEPELDEHIRICQDNAKKMRCQLPTYMECPVQGCNAHFEGANSWDDRMEHVAKHLDGSGPETKAQMVIGGDEDKTLVEWASRPEVAIIKLNEWGQWRLCSSPKSAGRVRKETTAQVTDSDADADGESDDY